VLHLEDLKEGRIVLSVPKTNAAIVAHTTTQRAPAEVRWPIGLNAAWVWLTVRLRLDEENMGLVVVSLLLGNAWVYKKSIVGPMYACLNASSAAQAALR
jgi:hypothetical protein